MKKSQLIIIAIIALLLITGACFKLGFIVGKKSLEKELNEARRIIDAFAPPLEEIFAVNGQIKEIGDNTITLEVSSSQLQGPPLPGEEPEIEIIKVIVGENTKIIKTETVVDPLNETEQTEITLNDLKTEDWIYVESEENIKNKKEFTAKLIKPTDPPSGKAEPLEIPPSSLDDEPAAPP